jgi:hypothetical protein
MISSTFRLVVAPAARVAPEASVPRETPLNKGLNVKVAAEVVGIVSQSSTLTDFSATKKLAGKVREPRDTFPDKTE